MWASHEKQSARSSAAAEHDRLAFTDSDDFDASLSRLRFDLLVTSQGALKAHLTWATRAHAPDIIDARRN
jgi:hypothetical protein